MISISISITAIARSSDAFTVVLLVMVLMNGMKIVVLIVVVLAVGTEVVGNVWLTAGTVIGIRHSVEVKFSVMVCSIGRYEMPTSST